MDAQDISLSLRLLLAMVLLFAGGRKVLGAFKGEQSQLLVAIGFRERTAAAFAGVLPFAEIGLGTWLLSNWHTGVALIVTTALMACFTAVLALAVCRDYDAPCGCFGPSEVPVGLGSILITALLGGAGFAATVLESLADTPILSLRDVTLSIVIVSALLAAVFMVVKALLVEIDRVRALESVKRAAV